MKRKEIEICLTEERCFAESYLFFIMLSANLSCLHNFHLFGDERLAEHTPVPDPSHVNPPVVLLALNRILLSHCIEKLQLFLVVDLHFHICMVCVCKCVCVCVCVCV